MSIEAGTTKYGNYYWCVKTSLSGNGEIFLMADRAEIKPDGSLSFWTVRTGDKSSFINFAFAHGNWTAFYAASLIDGGAVSVEHWQEKTTKSRSTGKHSNESIEDAILRLITSKGPLTVRESAQSTKRFDSDQIREAATAMVLIGPITEEAAGRTVRYRVAP